MPIFFTSSLSPSSSFLYPSKSGSSPATDASPVTPSSLSHFPKISFSLSLTTLRHSIIPTAHNSNDAALSSSTTGLLDHASSPSPSPLLEKKARDWKSAREYFDSGTLHQGRVDSCNGGGLMVRFHSLLGFLPFPQLGTSHSCKDPQKTIHDIAKGLIGSVLSVKVIEVDEESKKLILSEKEALWSNFSHTINEGDIFAGRVGTVEDFGAFVHLQFSDGLYHLTGLVHVSEVSWDLIQDVRDVLHKGDDVRVKVINIDRQKHRIGLSIKQLEEDPLLETLDKVISQDSSVGSDHLRMSNTSTIEPLPGLEAIFQELLREDGIDDIRINRQGFEKRVVSQDLQLWLSNAPPINRRFTLIARAGRQVQEIQLMTTLDQEGIKKALQHALERVP